MSNGGKKSNKSKKQKSPKRVQKDKKRKLSKDKEVLFEKKKKIKTLRKSKGKPPKTTDGQNIKNYMIEEGVRGDYRDYALLMEDKIIDYKKAIIISTKSGASITLTPGLVLIHKKKLKNVVSKDVAEKFWHPISGRV